MRAKREQLAKLETLDNGKPISEALWDIVSDAHITRKHFGVKGIRMERLQRSTNSIVESAIDKARGMSNAGFLFKASTLRA